MKKSEIVPFYMFLLVTSVIALIPAHGQQLPKISTPQKQKPNSVKVQPAFKKGAAKAILKIMCDVDAKVYVDGVFQGNTSSGIAYKLPLERGIYQIKVVSSKYGVSEIKDAYEVQNVTQQDYWNVQLKDDEISSKGSELKSIIDECLVIWHSGSTGNGYSIKQSVRTQIIESKIQVINESQQFDSENKKFSHSFSTYEMDLKTMKSFKIVKSDNEELSRKYSGSTYSLQIEGLGTYTNNDIINPSYNNTKEIPNLFIYIKEVCKEDLKIKLTNFFNN